MKRSFLLDTVDAFIFKARVIIIPIICLSTLFAALNVINCYFENALRCAVITLIAITALVLVRVIEKIINRRKVTYIANAIVKPTVDAPRTNQQRLEDYIREHEHDV